MSEVSLSSVDFDELDRYYGSSFSPTTSSAANFHERIFAQGDDCRAFTKTAVLRANRSEIEDKTQRIARNNGIAPIEIGGTVEVKVEATWGGQQGPTINVGASGEIRDDNGNYGKAEIKQDSTGQGSATITAGHTEEKKG